METANHECYVSVEVAKLLKKAGFDWEVNHSYPNCESLDNSCSGYMEDLSFYHNLNDGKYGGMSAPTLDVAQRWLRKIKNVVLLVDFNNDEDCEENERYGVTIYTGKERIIELATYPTYEEAQEAGINKALEIILEKGE